MSIPRLQSVFIAAGIGYLVTLAWQPYPAHWLVKATPILILAAGLWYHCRSVPATLALLFSAAGDMLLALPLVNGFVLGLGAFLIAHLLYGFCFLRWADFQRISRRGVGLTVGVFAALASVILPNTGDLRMAVSLYMGVIGLMVITALLINGKAQWLVAGAMTFAVSDTLIAVDKFITPLVGAAYWIMLTYYAAQLMLFTGLCAKLGHRGERNTP